MVQSVSRGGACSRRRSSSPYRAPDGARGSWCSRWSDSRAGAPSSAGACGASRPNVHSWTTGVSEKACDSLLSSAATPGGVGPGLCGRMARRGWGDRANVCACWTRERVEPASCVGRCSDLLSPVRHSPLYVLRMRCVPRRVKCSGARGAGERYRMGPCRAVKVIPRRPLPFTTVNRA